MPAADADSPPTDAGRAEGLAGLAARGLRAAGRLLLAPQRLLTSLAFVIGAVTALGALGFSWLVEWVTELSFGGIGVWLQQNGLYLWLLPLLPMSGALLVGLLTYYFAPEAEGHGVPEVMDAMARKSGRIRPRVAGAKALASALTIGTGGAAGTEGPIIQIGAAIGSGFGQWLRVSLNDIRVLIGCGAAAGIAAIFNAPLAGILFAVEVLLRDLTLRNFFPIIIASAISMTMTHAFKGSDEAIFQVPFEFTREGIDHVYRFTVPEFGNYLALGLLCGLVAVAFVKALYFSEDAFRRLPVHRIVRPVVGAALLGLVAIAVLALTDGSVPPPEGHAAVSIRQLGEQVWHDPPPIMGNGYPVIRQTLAPQAYTGFDRWTWVALLALLTGKALATCLTLGSGGSGGVFAPSLYLGATAGALFGLGVQQVPAFADTTPGAYALVGMAAVVGSSIHAPLTAMFIVFELTRDYKVVLPIMIACAAGLSVAQWIEPASIYTLKLLRRGVRLGGADARLLEGIAVREIPRHPAPLVDPDDPVEALVRKMRTTSANDFLVVSGKGELVGMVLGDDLRTLLLEAEAIPLLTVTDVMRADVTRIELDETLDSVLDKFAGAASQSLPLRVPAADGARARFELVTRAAVMNRYYQAVADSRR